MLQGRKTIKLCKFPKGMIDEYTELKHEKLSITGGVEEKLATYKHTFVRLTEETSGRKWGGGSCGDQETRSDGLTQWQRPLTT